MSTMNRMWNTRNQFQGQEKRVLCVCSAGLLRSPTIAWVLSQEPYNFNTRCAGVETEYALIPVDDVLVEWADQIVCAGGEHLGKLVHEFGTKVADKTVVLDIPDKYPRMDPELIRLIRERYKEVG